MGGFVCNLPVVVYCKGTVTTFKLSSVYWCCQCHSASQLSSSKGVTQKCLLLSTNMMCQKYQCSVREPIPRKDVMCCNVQRLTKPFGDVSTWLRRCMEEAHKLSHSFHTTRRNNGPFLCVSPWMYVNTIHVSKGDMNYSSNDLCDCKRFLRTCKENVNNVIIQM